MDQDAVPENSMPSLEDDGSKTTAIQKQKYPGVGGPTSTFHKLQQETEAEHLGTLAWRSPRRAQRETQPCRGHQCDSQKSDRTAVQRSGCQDFERNCKTASTRDRIPVAMMSGQKLSVKITKLEIGSSSWSRIKASCFRGGLHVNLLCFFFAAFCRDCLWSLLGIDPPTASPTPVPVPTSPAPVPIQLQRQRH